MVMNGSYATAFAADTSAAPVAVSEASGDASGATTTDVQSAEDVNGATASDGQDSENTNAVDDKTPQQSSDAPAASARRAPAATKAVSLNGQASYDTIAAALAAAKKGDTISLNADLTENVTITKGVTLDLGGHTLTGNGGSVITSKVTSIVRNGTITGGNATKGGGINVQSGSITVKDVTLTGNTATGSGASGAAIYAADSAGILYVNGCTIEGNTSTWGSMIGTGASHKSSVTVINTTIKDNKVNSVSGTYGAIYVYGKNMIIRNNTVSSSDVSDDGISVTGTGTVNFDQGGSYAGAVCLKGATVIADGKNMKTPDGFGLKVNASEQGTISNFKVNGNTKVPQATKALISATTGANKAKITISNVSLTNNKIANSNQYAIYLNQSGRSGTSITLSNVTVTGNTGGSSAVFSDGGSAWTWIKNSTIANNQVGNAAIHVNSGGVDLRTSTVTGNKSTNAGQKAGGVMANNFGTFAFTSGALYGNQNASGDPSDVYVDNGYTKLTDVTQMTAEGVDFSDYVWNKNGDKSKTEYPNQANYDDTIFYAEGKKQTYVAQIGETKYTTVNAALKAAKSGDTIKLISEGTDLAMEPAELSGKSVTIDLNGHTLATSDGKGSLVDVKTDALTLVNTSDQTASIKNPVTGDGGDVNIYSNTTVGGQTYGNLLLSNGKPNPIDMKQGTLKLAGTFNSNTWVQVANGKGTIQAGSADEGGLTFAGNNIDDNNKLNITVTGADDEFAKFNSENEAVDDLVLVNGGSYRLAKRVKVTNLNETGKQFTAVRYDAAKGAIVLHKVTREKGVYVDGVDGSDETGDGSYDKPFKTMQKALDYYNAHKDKYEAVYVKDTVTVSNAQTWDGKGATICRDPGFDGNLVNVKGDLRLKNITFDGMAPSVTKTKSMFNVANGGVLSLDDKATLQNNSSYDVNDLTYGGAIYGAGGSTVTLKSGSKVCDNDATWGGGVYSAGNVVLDGGEVSGNAAKDPVSSVGFKAAGGGICMNNYDNGLVEGLAAHLDFKSGTVSGNTSEYYGGGIALRPRKVNDNEYPDQKVTMKMIGGTIDGNSAASAGGGLFVQCKSVATISAGKITNNVAEGDETVFTGGGIYVNGTNSGNRAQFPNGELHLTNVIVKDNSASGMGGGLADCPTSTVRMYVTEGGAIYQNSSDQGVNEVYTKSGYVAIPGGNHSGTTNITISPVMLGGGAYQWVYAQDTPDGKHKAGDLVDTADMRDAHDIALNNPVKDGSTQATAAKQLAKVLITGNKATGTNKHGGGIGTNGDVYIGKEGEYIDITGEKVWKNPDSTNIPDAVELILQVKDINGKWTEVARKTATKTDNWKVTFSDLPKGSYPDGTDLEYRVVENPKFVALFNGLPTSIKITIGQLFNSVAGNEVVTGNVGKVTNEDKTTSISVIKKWDDSEDADGLRPSEITVHLLANGEDTGKTLALSEDNNWSGEFSDLLVYDKGVAIAYTVQEDVPEGYTADVSGSAADGFTIVNTHTPEKPHEEKPKSKPKKKHAIPQTSDPTSTTLIYTLAVSGAGMVAAGLHGSRRKRERK